MGSGLIGDAGNQAIIDFLDRELISEAAGDVLEIGCFMGHTTCYLARWAEKTGKRVFAVDPFDINTDEPRSGLYSEYLDGLDQMLVYQKNVSGFTNVITLPVKSSFVDFSSGQQFCCVFIDGAHDLRSVEHDIRLARQHLSTGGVILVHDYAHDIPDVTAAVDGEISRPDQCWHTFREIGHTLIGLQPC